MKHLRRAIQVMACMLVGALFSANACTKVVVYAGDTQTAAIAKSFFSNLDTTMNASRTVLTGMGYKLDSVANQQNRLVTGWQPVKSDSHYMNLFRRKDYSSSVGSYYQVIVDFSDTTPTTAVTVATVVKSVAGKLDSTQIIEKEFLRQLEDQLRSPQIELNNVEVKNR